MDTSLLPIVFLCVIVFMRDCECVCVCVCVHHAVNVAVPPLLLSVLLHEKHWAASIQTWSKDHTIMMAVALVRDKA